MADGIPDYLDIPGVGRFKVKQRRRLKDDEWGFFEKKTNTLVINRNVSKVAKHSILLREIFHIAKNLLGGMDDFLEAAPIIVLTFLVQSDLYSQLSKEELDEFLQSFKQG